MSVIDAENSRRNPKQSNLTSAQPNPAFLSADRPGVETSPPDPGPLLPHTRRILERRFGVENLWRHFESLNGGSTFP